MSESTIYISSKVMKDIKASIGSCPPESGGILALKDDRIVDFYFDDKGSTEGDFYVPDGTAVMKKANEWWRLYGYSFGGIVHSHPIDTSIKLSKTDVKSAVAIMKCNQFSSMIMIVVQGIDMMEASIVKRSGEIYPCRLVTCDL